MALTDRDRAILDFERGWWLEAEPKEAAIRTRLDLSPSRYRALLAAIVDDPEALSIDPLLVRRLRKKRDTKRQARFEGRPTGEPPRR